MTIALIDTLSDKNDNVRETVAKSIVDTGKKLPKLTVTLCANYLEKHPKLPDTHRVSILHVINRILTYQQQQDGDVPFDTETFQLLTRITMAELTMPKVCSRIISSD